MAKKLKHKKRHGLRVLETRDINVNDFVIRKRFRPPTDEDVEKLRGSLKVLGQPRAVTVRKHPDEDDKYIVIAGAALVEAAKLEGWTSVRADIVKCTKAQAYRWEIAENLIRHQLTALEEGEHFAEWGRSIAEDEQEDSGQNVAKPKKGRPKGLISKIESNLPVKGKTAKARRKTIQRRLKFASMTQEAKDAVRQAGLDTDPSALREIAKEATAEAQVDKVQEIVKRKATSEGKDESKKRKGKKHRPRRESSLSAKDRVALDKLIGAWKKARKLNRAFSRASPAVRACFIEAILQSVSDDTDGLKTELQPQEQEDNQDEPIQDDTTIQDDAIDGADDDHNDD